MFTDRDSYDPAPSCLNCGYRARDLPLDIPLRHERGDPVLTPTERRRKQRLMGKP